MTDEAENSCFESVTVEYHRISNRHVQLVFKPGKRVHKLAFCWDTYTVASALNFHMSVLHTKHHKMNFRRLHPAQIENIEKFGLRIFRTCDKFAHLVPDIFLTASLFLGGFGLNPYIPFFGSRPTWW